MSASDPQSFNRYAYVSNDPVNRVDPEGLCSFNIAIAGGRNLTADQNTALRSEITRIFGTAGRGVNFVTGANADYTLSIVSNAPASVSANAVGATGVGNNFGAVYIDRLTASARRDAASETAFNQNSNALAIGLGRAGSHEIGHYLLAQLYDSSSIKGVMHAGFGGLPSWFLALQDFVNWVGSIGEPVGTVTVGEFEPKRIIRS